MKILDHLDSENIMLVNLIYHSPKKDYDYKDYLDIIYKDLRTGEKKLHTIEEPEIEIYFAKEEARDYDYNKSFIEFKDVEMHRCKYKDLPFYIAKVAGQEYVNYIKNAIQTNNSSKIKNIHKYKYVFGSDYDIENWYKIQWFLNNHNDKEKPLTKMFLDIEVDSIDIEGFPSDGDCPINAVTIVDEESMTSFTFLLRNERNTQIKQFENNVDEVVQEMNDMFEESYGKIEYRFYMYDDERDMLVDVFKLINTLKRDFLLVWNMSFDIPYIIARLKRLGLDPVKVMCHKDFKIKELYYKKDHKNFQVQNKSDYFVISSYTVYLDQMIVYAALRKGQGELRSFSLNSVAKEEIGDEKLDYSEDANIKTLPYVDYKKFVIYNIKDVLLQLGIERKTKDIENVYLRAYTNATTYEKVFKQTVFLKNRAYIEYYKQGLIIGNNVNIDYGMDSEKEEEDDDEKFDGALVAEPTLNDYTGIELFGPSMYIFDNVVDMDFSSMYPNTIISFNVAPNTMIGKLIIGEEDIQNVYKTAADKNGKKEDLGKDFVDNLLTGNVLNMGTKWFNLPSTLELSKLVEEEFNVKRRKVYKVNDELFNKYYLEGVVIDVDIDEE